MTTIKPLKLFKSWEILVYVICADYSYSPGYCE